MKQARETPSWSWRHAIARSDLPSTTRHVLLTISLYMNDVGGGCYPTTQQLAEATGLSERAVCEHISKAKLAGWLVVSQHGFRGQKWRNNQYEASWPEEKGTDPSDIKALTEGQRLNEIGTDAKSARHEKALTFTQKGTDPSDIKALTEGQSILPVTYPIKSSLSETSSDSASGKAKKKISYPDDFEVFWKSYPRTPNMSKKEALDAWKRLDAADKLACIAAVPAYRAFLATKPDLSEIHACRFISKRRFDSYAEQVAAKPVLDDAGWLKRLNYGRTQNRWSTPQWGPAPGLAGCRVPQHLIQTQDGADWREMENAA